MRLAALLVVLAASLSAQTPEQLFRERKFDEARSMLRDRIARDKSDHLAHYWMGRIAEDEDKFGEAIDWFEKAVKLRDTSALYHTWLGNAVGGEAGRANKLRQPFLARRVKSEFERAVALDPTMLDPRFGLVEFYSQAPGFMGGGIDKAKEQAQEIKKIRPFRGHFAEGIIARRQKDVPGEEAAYKAALAAMPDSIVTFYSLASYYRRQQRWDEALAVYDSLMQRHPADVPVHASWGVTASLAGKHLDRAERELKSWLAAPPKDAPATTTSFVRYHLGQVYEKTARKEPARTEYNEAIKLNPQNNDAKKALAALK